MKYIARKIDKRAKWDPHASLAPEEVAADAITRDLKTEDNALSFWQCGNSTELEINEIVLAIAANFDHLSKVDLVWVERSPMEQDGVSFERSEGRTPVADLKDAHLDAVRLDLTRLGAVARLVAAAIRDSGQLRRVSEAQVVRILTEGVKSGRLKLKDLKDNLQAKVAAKLHP